MYVIILIKYINFTLQKSSWKGRKIGFEMSRLFKIWIFILILYFIKIKICRLFFVFIHFQEMEIKKMAKEGNNDGCKILAKQLVQLRKQKTRIYTANSKVI